MGWGEGHGKWSGDGWTLEMGGEEWAWWIAGGGGGGK